jgi:alpha-L-rhamnosidase
MISPPARPWTAAFIGSPHRAVAAPIFRREFGVDSDHGPLLRATLRSTALGVVESLINGVPTSEEVLAPGWSSYEWRLRSREHDVTALITSSRVVLAFRAGNGWYRGRLGWLGAKAVYGDQIAISAEVVLEFADGHRQVVCSDRQWRVSTGATGANDLYDGQHIDARTEPAGWTTPEFDDSRWDQPVVVPFDPERVVVSETPPIVRQESLRPTAISALSGNRLLVDFGQNLVGWLRLSVVAPSGHTITIRHAEVLEQNELAVRPLRSARATDAFVCSGNRDVFEPTMTFHGFRFAEIHGWLGTAAELGEAVEAVVVSSDLPRRGWFRSSSPALNRLHENVIWSMRGNFLGVPTDCPQRDERLGWTGDIAVFAPTASFLFDSSAFLSDWMRDLALEQQANAGVVPFVVPNVLKHFDTSATPLHDHGSTPTAIWGDAAVWVPWAIWMANGKRDVLEEHYPTMAAHARSLANALNPKGLWEHGFQFGDWLDPTAPPENPFAASTPNALVATACAYRTAQMLISTTTELGFLDDREEFVALATRLRTAFRDAFLDGPSLRVRTQTAYALSIFFGLLDDHEIRPAGDQLARLVREGGFHIATGFAGTAYVLDALSMSGHLEEAYGLLLQTECPSWLYPVYMGATTVWERWDSITPDGSINPGEMTSFNHYAFGSVADWMHRIVGGLAPLEPGYSKVVIEPRPHASLHESITTLDTRHGRIQVTWERVTDRLRLCVELPRQVTARVTVNGETSEVTGGTHNFT